MTRRVDRVQSASSLAFRLRCDLNLMDVQTNPVPHHHHHHKHTQSPILSVACRLALKVICVFV